MFVCVLSWLRRSLFARQEKFYAVGPGTVEEVAKEPPQPPLPDVEKRYPYNHIDGYSTQLAAKKNLLGGQVDYAQRAQYLDAK